MRPGILLKHLLYLLPGTLLLTFALFFYTIDYARFIHFLKTQHPGMYDIENLESYFLPDKFYISQIACLIFTSVYFFSSILFLHRIPEFIQSIRDFIKELVLYIKKIIALYVDLPGYQKIITLTIFAIILIHHSIYIYKIPFTTDETFPYVYFIKQSFWISWIYYPEPNHIFFNQVCSLFDLLPGDHVLSMRLPSLLTYTLLLIVLFAFTSRYFGFLTAITALALCAFSLNATYYSINGRGYTLLSFFAVVSSIAIFHYCNNPEKKILLKIFILSSVLGAYTITVFLFPFAAIIAYGILAGNKKVRKNIFYAALITGVLVFILYAPIISLSGIKAIAGNKWVKARDLDYLLHILPVAIAESIDYILGTQKKGYLLIIPFLLISIYLYKKNLLSYNEKNWLLLFFVSVLTSFILIFLIKNFPPYRVWTYYVYFFYSCLAILLTKIISLLSSNRTIRTIILSTISAVFVFFMISRFNIEPSLLNFNKRLHKEVNAIYKEQPTAIFIDQHELLELYLRLKFILEEKKIDIDIAKWDNGKEYDFIIIYNKVPEGLSEKGYQQVSDFDHSMILKKNLP